MSTNSTITDNFDLYFLATDCISIQVHLKVSSFILYLKYEQSQLIFLFVFLNRVYEIIRIPHILFFFISNTKPLPVYLAYILSFYFHFLGIALGLEKVALLNSVIISAD